MRKPSPDSGMTPWINLDGHVAIPIRGENTKVSKLSGSCSSSGARSLNSSSWNTILKASADGEGDGLQEKLCS